MIALQGTCYKTLAWTQMHSLWDTSFYLRLKNQRKSKMQIESYIKLKQDEQDRYHMTPHPVEFDMYYSCEDPR